MPRPTSVVIDLAAIGDNIAVLKRSLGASQFMAVVKADAYGHGAIPVARYIEKMVDAFAVAFIAEAVDLRTAGISKPILVLEGPHSAIDVTLATQHDLWPALHDLAQIEWYRAHQSAPSRAWIKIDTGMHRLGFSPTDLSLVQQALQDLGCDHLTLMSHLAAAESPDSPLTAKQLSQWGKLTSRWSGDVSLCNSAASRLGLTKNSDWARVGYAIYGGFVKGLASNSTLKPAMHFETAVIAVKQIAAGESVGYGGQWTADRDSTIATLPVGYGDGYPWSAPNGAPVQINDLIAPLVGRVSMDMVTVDVTDCGPVEIGTPVVLWGQTPGVDAVADACGTIGYELMTRMTGRAERCYKN